VLFQRLLVLAFRSFSRGGCVLLAHALTVSLLAVPAPAGAAGGARPQRISAARAESHGSTARFAVPLAKYGEWLRLEDGRVAWRPDVADEWRPYFDGSWVWSEAGWYWVSDEPWAWATYHFGRWRHDSRLDWIWLPGEEWGPAWVVWRMGPGLVGWAPRPDEGAVLAPHWTFVPTSRLAAAHAPAVALPAGRLAASFVASTPLVSAPGAAP
jgi:hypothetical protein